MRPIVLAAALFATVAQAAGPLAIRSGDYVLADTPCREAPFAALMHYDGHALSGPHESACTTRLLGRTGGDVRLATTCRALGDGTPAKPSTFVARYRVDSPTSLTVIAATGSPRRYRWCGR